MPVFDALRAIMNTFTIELLLCFINRKCSAFNVLLHTSWKNSEACLYCTWVFHKVLVLAICFDANLYLHDAQLKIYLAHKTSSRQGTLSLENDWIYYKCSCLHVISIRDPITLSCQHTVKVKAVVIYTFAGYIMHSYDGNTPA